MVLTAPAFLRSPARNPARGYAEVLLAIAAVTAGGWYLPLNYRSLGPLYLLAVIALSLRVGRWPGLAAAALSGVAWNFVFVPPRMSFSVLHFEDVLLLASYLLAALIGSQLTALRAAGAEAKRAADSDRLHRALLDGVSHEFRTPIAVLRSASEQLGAADAARRAVLVSEIVLATQRLDRLVGNLLDQSRLEAGAVNPLPDWCEAGELIGAARRALGAQLDGRPLQVALPADLPPFHADAALMEHVLANLLLNAAMHTPRGTPIRIEAGVDAPQARVFIRVSDSGPGIPEEQRDGLFEKFQRAGRRTAGGLGLGLSIVRGFMLAQGGSVELRCPPAGGSQFTIFLPCG